MSTVVLLGWLTFFENFPQFTPMAVFVVLVVIAGHRETLFGDETGMTGSVVVIVAAVFAFQHDAPVLGPAICSLAGALQWGHLRDRAWSRLIVNSSAATLSAALAGLCVSASSEPRSSFGWAGVLIGAVIVYWVLNNFIVGLAMSSANGDRSLTQITNLIRSDTQMIFFALLGGLCGLLVLEVGLWEGAAALVGVLVAVDMLVIARPRPFTVRMQHPGLMARFTQAASICGAGVTAYLAAGPLGPVAAWLAAMAFGAGTTFVVTALALRSRVGVWDAPLALGVAMAAAPLIVVAAVAGCVAGAVGPVPALVVGIVASASVLLGRAWQQRRSTPEPVDDVAALAILELALAERREGSTGD